MAFEGKAKKIRTLLSESKNRQNKEEQINDYYNNSKKNEENEANIQNEEKDSN